METRAPFRLPFGVFCRTGGKQAAIHIDWNVKWPEIDDAFRYPRRQHLVKNRATFQPVDYLNTKCARCRMSRVQLSLEAWPKPKSRSTLGPDGVRTMWHRASFPVGVPERKAIKRTNLSRRTFTKRYAARTMGIGSLDGVFFWSGASEDKAFGSRSRTLSLY